MTAISWHTMQPVATNGMIFRNYAAGKSRFTRWCGQIPFYDIQFISILGFYLRSVGKFGFWLVDEVVAWVIVWVKAPGHACGVRLSPHASSGNAVTFEFSRFWSKFIQIEFVYKSSISAIWRKNPIPWGLKSQDFQYWIEILFYIWVKNKLKNELLFGISLF